MAVVVIVLCVLRLQQLLSGMDSLDNAVGLAGRIVGFVVAADGAVGSIIATNKDNPSLADVQAPGGALVVGAVLMAASQL